MTRVGSLSLVVLIVAGCATTTAETPIASRSAEPTAATAGPATTATEPEPTVDAAAAILAECANAPEAPAEPVVITIRANSSGFNTDRLEGAVHCQPFTITFTNTDVLAHNVAIYPSDTIRQALFLHEPFPGPGTRTLEIPALPAGEYVFNCQPHSSTMRGTLIVSP